MPTFEKSVERWRVAARRQAAWAAKHWGVELDEHDLLALVERESRGDATEDSGAYWGLGQVGPAALKDYDASVAGRELPVPREWLRDEEHAEEQLRVVAWLTAHGRKVVSTWSMPDAKERADLWADVRYGWGPGNLRDAISRWREEHGRSPTFDELEAATPPEWDGDGDGRTDVRPFIHARAVHKRAAQDRGENPFDLADVAEGAAIALGTWLALSVGVGGLALVAVGAWLLLRRPHVR